MSKKLFVLANESEELFAGVTGQFKPETPLERDICVELAHARWRLRRLWVIQTAMIDKEMDRQQPALKENFKTFDEGTRVANAFESLASNQRALGTLTSYESRLTRNFHRLAARLQELQRARQKNDETDRIC